jgi:hypothetical protein
VGLPLRKLKSFKTFSLRFIVLISILKTRHLRKLQGTGILIKDAPDIRYPAGYQIALPDIR